MPHLKIITNLPRDKIPYQFTNKTCAVVAKALGKPVEYVVVSVTPDVLLSFGGTDDPAAQAVLMSIGAIGVQENRKTSRIIGEHIEETLGIKKDRLYIHFQNADKADVGFNGTTFYEIFGGK